MTLETQIDELEAKSQAGSLDVSASRDGAVYWSNDFDKDGRPTNRARAEAFCHDSQGPHQTLELTADGQRVDELARAERFSPSERADRVENLCAEASSQYSKNAEGNVNTFVVGGHPDRYFRSVELPQLVENEKITSINGVPRREIAELHGRDPDAAFNRVCEAELQRDREQTQTGPDLEHREALYREQLIAQGRDPDRIGEATQPMSQQERGWRRQAAAREQEQGHEQEEHYKDGPDR